MTDDPTWMARALAQAALAADAGEVPVGAVLVRDGQVLAEAHNRTLTDGDPTAHAEMVALRAGARAAGNHRLVDTTLYVTLEPCAMCAGALVQARVSRVVFGAADLRAGAVASVFRVFDAAPLNHHPAWCGGVMAGESAALLREFFRARRNAGSAVTVVGAGDDPAPPLVRP